MSTYLENYCTIEDIQLVAPFVFDYDRKRVISNWVSHSGSDASTIYKAGSVGKLSMLYSNDIELTSVSDIASIDADGKFFFDEDADVVYYRPTSTNNPNFDESVAAGRDNKTLFTEFISRSSDFVRSYINKPIYKNKGVGTGDSLGRDFPEVIVRSTALLSASLAIMAYDREKGEELQNLAYNPNDNNGLLDLIRRGVISLDQDEDGRDKIVKELQKHDIEVRPMICGSMGTQPFYVKEYGKKELPNVSIIDKYGFYIPNHPKLTYDEILFISKIINMGISK